MKKKIVLIAEDNPTISASFVAALTTLPVAVRTAMDGREAIEAIAKETPDLLLLDLLMPRMSGIEVLAYMQKKYPSVPIVIFTNSGRETTRNRCMEMGAKEYLVKSNCSLQDLREAVQRYV